jgi:hypothetical protein
LVVVVLVPLLVGCHGYTYAEIPASRMAEGSECFETCKKSQVTDDAIVDCVAKCSAAVTGDGECSIHDHIHSCWDVEHVNGAKTALVGVGALDGCVASAVWFAEGAANATTRSPR